MFPLVVPLSTLAGLAFALAIRSGAEGSRTSAVLATLRGVLALALGITVLLGDRYQGGDPDWLRLASWSTAMFSLGSALYVRLRFTDRLVTDQTWDLTTRNRARRVGRDWLLLAALDGLIAAQVEDFSTPVWILLFLELFALPIVLGVGLLREAREQQVGGETARAVGRAFLWIPGSCVGLLVAAALGVIPGQALIVGTLAYAASVVILPVGMWRAVRARNRPANSTATRWPAESGLLVLAVLAVLALTSSFVRHAGRCAGELVEVTAPNGWRSFPVTALGDNQRLGWFSVRGFTVRYKTYPASIADASLGDPALCFAGSVSLASWFDRDMYRMVSDLRLRYDRTRDVYVVSGQPWTPDEELVTAFRRELSPRFAFDRAESRSLLLAGLGFTLLGAFAFLTERRLAKQRVSDPFLRPRSGYPFARASLLIAVLVPCILEARYLAGSDPRPGRELVVDYVSP